MDEDLMHALVHFSHAKLFWEQAHGLFGIRRPRLNPDTWSCDIICDDQFTGTERVQMIFVMWAIWHSRNRVTHDDDQLEPFTSVRRIREDLALLDIPHSHAAVLPGHGWRPPDSGVVKINTDAALSMDSDKVGVGVEHVLTQPCWVLGVNLILGSRILLSVRRSRFEMELFLQIYGVSHM